MLPPELIGLHLADLRRAFQLVAEYEHHDIGKLPGALLDRLKQNGYVVTVDGKAHWNSGIEVHYKIYALWQQAMLDYLAKEG
jgi:hypothetical protein